MIQNRELTMDDYLAMLRRRAKMIVIPALLAPLVGFLVSYAFPQKFTSQAMIMVEEQKVPENMVQPVVTADINARMATLKQQITSQKDLQPVVERIYPGRNSREVGDIIDNIRLNMDVQQVPTDLLPASPKKKPGTQGGPGGQFYLNYTAANAQEARQICNELATLLLEENLKSIQAAASGTSDVLSRGLEDAKHNLDELDSKLAAFKKQYAGQLPGDEESNLKILMGLNTQLEANTQTLSRAEQDRAYTESMLAQQLGAWRSSQSSTNPQTLEKQLSELQSQLLQLQAKYTADHPDVVKAKADISEVKKKLAEINSASTEATDAGSEKGSATEPPDIRQLRLQLHQYGELITAATRSQKRLQDEIATYQNRVSLSPAVEEQYKALTRDYENQQKTYQELLTKKSSADLTVKMNNQSEGERMFLLDEAKVPGSPSFPNRLLFAAGGLGAGLALGMALAMWFEFRDTSIRTEADAEAALELPMLVSVPWVGLAAAQNNHGKGRFWNRNKSPDQPGEKVGV
jgi:polysaccharide chain length determinant protein (PEP-CTERM system associated)